MSEAKFTPGPWWANEYGIRDRGGFICALTWPSRYDGQQERHAKETAQREADARLIAAAPDLYAALQAIVDASDSKAAQGGEMWWAEAVYPAVDAARAALKRAQEGS